MATTSVVGVEIANRFGPETSNWTTDGWLGPMGDTVANLSAVLTIPAPELVYTASLFGSVTRTSVTPASASFHEPPPSLLS